MQISAKVFRVMFMSLGFMYFSMNCAYADYSMAVVQDEYIVLANFDDESFSDVEYLLISNLLGEYIADSIDDSLIFTNDQLGDPNELRESLISMQGEFEIFYLEITKGPARVASAGTSIWIDVYYENSSMYVGSLSLPFLQLSSLIELF